MLDMKLLLSILFLTVPLFIFSQEDIEEIETYQRKLWVIETNLELVNPVNAFGRNVDSNKFGMSLNVLRERTIDGPLFWGGGIHFFNLGSENTTYTDDLTFEEISESANSLEIGLDILFRYYPDFFFGPVEPFFEVMMGPRFFYSYTSSQSLTLGESIGFDVNDFDVSLAYGIGVGLHTTVYNQYGINTKLLFHPGLISSYLVKRNDDTIISENPLDFFRSVSSSSDIFRFQLGFIAIF